MTEYLGQHWIFSIFITIVLGAIGSGLWESLLKPMASTAGNFLFTVVTFGAKTAQNRIYRSAAMGHHELPSIHVFLFACCLIFGLFISMPMLIYINPETVYNSEAVQSACQSTTPDEKQNCIKHQIRTAVYSKFKYIGLIYIFSSVFIFYQFHSVNKANLLITYFCQSVKSIRPFINDNQYYLFEQRFSLMTSKNDYDALLHEIKKIAETNKSFLPKSYT